MSSQQAGVVTSECQTNKLLTPTTTSDAPELFLNTDDVAQRLSGTERERAATIQIRTSYNGCESKI